MPPYKLYRNKIKYATLAELMKQQDHCFIFHTLIKQKQIVNSWSI